MEGKALPSVFSRPLSDISILIKNKIHFDLRKNDVQDRVKVNLLKKPWWSYETLGLLESRTNSIQRQRGVLQSLAMAMPMHETVVSISRSSRGCKTSKKWGPEVAAQIIQTGFTLVEMG